MSPRAVSEANERAMAVRQELSRCVCVVYIVLACVFEGTYKIVYLYVFTWLNTTATTTLVPKFNVYSNVLNLLYFSCYFILVVGPLTI